MTVKYTLNPDVPLTSEEIAMIEAAKKLPFVYDEDCPPMTEDQRKASKTESYRQHDTAAHICRNK